MSKLEAARVLLTSPGVIALAVVFVLIVGALVIGKDDDDDRD